ncbi:hypothetical protein EYF80_000402 [Liparis tanakae]|uniref:Uncharacterized protein n=1 Tax=Liparis tanakae TaxID=230148 RepID=A0A4Z2JH95_9TELE|nr:hypothetical protein EYF80_000402 [Liparis tanakae]
MSQRIQAGRVKLEANKHSNHSSILNVPSSFSGVRLYSFGIEISLDFRFREQTLRHCEEHNKVSERTMNNRSRESQFEEEKRWRNNHQHRNLAFGRSELPVSCWCLQLLCPLPFHSPAAIGFKRPVGAASYRDEGSRVGRDSDLTAPQDKEPAQDAVTAKADSSPLTDLSDRI